VKITDARQLAKGTRLNFRKTPSSFARDCELITLHSDQTSPGRYVTRALVRFPHEPHREVSVRISQLTLAPVAAHSTTVVLDASSPFGNDYRAVCTCGWEGPRHEVYDSAAEARAEAAEDGEAHRG